MSNTAVALAPVLALNTVRFALWGADSQAHFIEQAEPLAIADLAAAVRDAIAAAPLRPFSTGNTGYYVNLTGVVVRVGDRRYTCKVQGNVSGIKTAAAPSSPSLGDALNGLVLPMKAFSTGSMGWYVSVKVPVGNTVCQVGLSVYVDGSKPKGGAVPF
jgi:hypothetical protein